MDLTLEQKDALTELINIGYGRAAGALSELTGYRISLEVPQVTMHAVEQIVPLLERVINGDVASVNQSFAGPISGNALLLLDERAAAVLSQLLVEGEAPSRDFDASAQEVITEVGNILLNACLGAFANLLHVQLSFTVPRLNVQTIRRVLQVVGNETGEEFDYGLMIHTRFYVKADDVTGYLVIILGIASLDRLLNELETWEKRQMQ